MLTCAAIAFASYKPDIALCRCGGHTHYNTGISTVSSMQIFIMQASWHVQDKHYKTLCLAECYIT